jgi:hypothetical protein
MSIFDLTPAGAYMQAIQAANAKDRENARRQPANPVKAARKWSFPGTALVTRSIGWTRDQVVGLSRSITLRAS